MENELDLTLRLGLPNPSVEKQLSLSTSTTTNDQGTNVVDGGRGGDSNNNGGEVLNLCRALWEDDKVVDDEGARINVDINLRVYNFVFKLFAGLPNTLNFDPYPMPITPEAPLWAPLNPPTSDHEYVRIDVPARRAHRNHIMLMANAKNESPNAYANRLRSGGGGYRGGRIEETKKCTNLNCNALTTPMWRSGPLGPKSLCNACGIKFRKEEQEKKSNIN